MGFASNIVIGSASFLLGMVFVSQVVDIPLLYLPLTDAAIDNGYHFYEMWYEAPGAVKALFHAAMGLPLIVLLLKLHKWTESALFFDGTSVALQLATIVLYLSVHIASLRTFLPDSNKGSNSFNFLPQPPPRDVPATDDEKIEAVRVLAAANALVGLLLLGVIGMQIGQEYAGNVEAREQAKIDNALRTEAEAKKDQ
ncbi:Protein csh3 [Vanrija albida]|uniref:Protein csh3 n=1 Tax=Vanrija albida TaxID=181172 RepID=A0ABR3PSM0_9TREE